jgi:hypothetical protein
MHLTCTNMPQASLKTALDKARKHRAAQNALECFSL